MHVRSGSGLIVALATLSIVAVARGAAPTFWHVSSRTELLKGELDDLSVDETGQVRLGPRTELLYEATAPFVWALAAMPDGGLCIGTGNEGKVFRIDRDGRASLLFDAPELEVHTIAVAPDGSLYVGTSPDGKIYRVGVDGTATTFFDPDDAYVWALAIDPQGTVFAATGRGGTIYKIAPDGQGAAFYETKATHVVSLAFDPDGNLLASTESPAEVFRIDPKGHGFILLESTFTELRALTVGPDGVIYAAAVRGDGTRQGGPISPASPEPAEQAVPVPSVSARITTIAVADVQVESPPQLSEPPPERSAPAKGAVYRILPDGIWDRIWESPADIPYDLLLEPDGALLVGTGPEGKIYELGTEPTRTTLLTRAMAQQVTRFLLDADGRRHYATANPGKLFAITEGLAAKGTYLSDVRDAQTVASWGSIRWRATIPDGSQLLLFTRSGNTRTPDETWSDWSKPYQNADGEQMTNPKARYLQWKAVFTRGRQSPILTSVTTAYLPRNLRPVVTSVTVHPPGTVFQKPFTTGEMEIAGYDSSQAKGTPEIRIEAAANAQSSPQTLGRRAYRKGLQTFAWTAEDANDDRLQFDVVYRQEGSTVWKTLKRQLWDPIFVWDTTSVPDGTYLLAIEASDAPSNSPDTALTGRRESAAFDVDNTPPHVEFGPVREGSNGPVLPVTIRDTQSAIERAEYSLDASLWRPVYPRDGIPDSRAEQFEIPLPDASTPVNVIVRATDVMNNTATAARGPASARR